MPLTKNDDEGHLDSFYFGLGDDAPGAGSPAVVVLLLELLMT